MLKYIVKRLLIFIPTFFVISLFIFGLSKFAPGDPVELLLKGKSEAASSNLADLLLSEDAYVKTAERLGLDKPTFYLSVSSAAYPDSLYKIRKQHHRELVSRFIDRHGNAKEVYAYYDKLRELEYGLAAIPEKNGRPETRRFLRMRVNELYLDYDEGSIVQSLDTMLQVAQGDTAYGRFAQLVPPTKTAYEAIAANATPYKIYIPTLHFYGLDNQYHVWMFGDMPWLSAVDSTPHHSLAKLRAEYDGLRPKRDSLNSLLKVTNLRMERTQSYLDTTPKAADADSLRGKIAEWQAEKTKLEGALTSLKPQLDDLETQIKTLDASIVRYVGKGFLRGDFGISYYDQLAVSKKMSDALYWTLIMNFFSIFISYLISIPLGVKSASWKLQNRKLIDGANTTVLFILYSLPSFWIAILCMMFFTNPEYGMNWFPAGGAYTKGTTYESQGFVGYWLDVLYHLSLPIFCVTYSSFAYLSRQMRGSMLGVVRQDYIRTARAKGLSEGKVIWKHAFRNSLFPIITLFSSVFPRALSGSIAIEFIFNVPGMGALVLDSINARDWPVVFTVAMFGAILTMVGNLVADMLYAVADPRISYDKK